MMDKGDLKSNVKEGKEERRNTQHSISKRRGFC